MSYEAGAGITRSRGPTCGDATVEPAKARRPPALARLRGHIPEGALFRPPMRPLAGMRARRMWPDADALIRRLALPLEEAPA